MQIQMDRVFSIHDLWNRLLQKLFKILLEKSKKKHTMSREEIFTLEAMKCLINREKGIIGISDISKKAALIAKLTLKELDETIE